MNPPTREWQMPELLSCPFCGGSPRISRIRDESLFSHAEVVKTCVRCDDCDVSTDYTEEGQEPEAVEKWNTRAATKAPPMPDVEALLSLLGVPVYQGDEMRDARKTVRDWLVAQGLVSAKE